MDFSILSDAIKILVQAIFGGFVTIVSLIIILNIFKYCVIGFFKLLCYFLVEK